MSVSYIMLNKSELENAVQKGVVSEESRERILKYVARLRENNVPVIFNLRHLRKICGISKREQNKYFGINRGQLYRQFNIPKRSGGIRTIEAPEDKLKTIQRWIKDDILDSFSTSEYATGFKKGMSIVDNARPHVGKELVINIDLKDFFPTIHYTDVIRVFSYMGYRTDVAHLLTRLCTNGNNVLPQGSPASPALSNLVSLRLDKRLGQLALKLNCTYSRYADDITFSGDKGIRAALPLIRDIIVDEGFEVNEDKVRLQYSHQRQEVTGLVVNERLSVSPRIKNEIKSAIHYCKKYGVADHMRYIGCDKFFYKEHLYGLAYFIHMVDVELGQKYLRELDEIQWDWSGKLLEE